MSLNSHPSCFVRAGAAARSLGITPDTLRHYEKTGLISPGRSANGYREYSDDIVHRLRVIRRAIAVGFTLDELTRFFAIRDRGGAPCRSVRKAAAEKLDRVEQELQRLTKLRDELSRLLDEWDDRLSGTPDGSPARLLESLPDGERAIPASNGSQGRQLCKRRGS